MPDSLTFADVYVKLRSAVAAAGGQSAFAAKAGLSVGYVSDVMNARRDPTSAAMLRALGLRKIVRYAPIERTTAE